MSDSFQFQHFIKIKQIQNEFLYLYLCLQHLNNQKSMERYENLKPLGEGTFGKCYLVRDRQTNQKCVLKKIDIKGMGQQEKANTTRQAIILQALDHPYIIKFLNTFQSKAGFLSIVMSYAEGGDLNKKIKEAKDYFPQNVILGWFTQIALAIKHIHQRKVIHRDLKSQNIFISKDNLIKLGDFGIAKSLKQSLQKVKTIVGTPYYMSPEICDNNQYTMKTDIWSLGVILYEMCSLKPPFQANNLTNLALKICRGDYSPIPNKYSKQLKKLIAQLLTINPDKRPNIHQVMKMPIIHSKIQQYVILAQKQEKVDIDETIQDVSVPSRKIQRTKPSISPRAFEGAPNLVMLPTSPTNVKEGKIKINQVKKGKITSSRKRQISEPIQSPRQIKKNIPSTIQIQKKKPTNLKGKKIQEYQPITKRKLDNSFDEMYESYYLNQIPIEELQEIINSERQLQPAKEQQWNNNISFVLKKYERESLELDFKEETQSETLKLMLISSLGVQKFQTLLQYVRKGSGFPCEDLTRTLRTQDIELLPLMSLYYGGYILNMS